MKTDVSKSTKTHLYESAGLVQVFGRDMIALYDEET